MTAWVAGPLALAALFVVFGAFVRLSGRGCGGSCTEASDSCAACPFASSDPANRGA